MLNLSFSEWWRFKTPFYAWFSRNFETAVLPLLWQWGFTHGHVFWRQPATQFCFFCLDKCTWSLVKQLSKAQDRFCLELQTYSGFQETWVQGQRFQHADWVSTRCLHTTRLLCMFGDHTFSKRFGKAVAWSSPALLHLLEWDGWVQRRVQIATKFPRLLGGCAKWLFAQRRSQKGPWFHWHWLCKARSVQSRLLQQGPLLFWGTARPMFEGRLFCFKILQEQPCPGSRDALQMKYAIHILWVPFSWHCFCWGQR